MALLGFGSVNDHERIPDEEFEDTSRKSYLKILENLYGFLFKRYPLLPILLMGIGLRIISFTRIPIWYDGALYHDVALGILKHGTFVTATDNISTWGYSLTYPLYLSFFYNFLGYNLFSTHLACLIAGVLAIFVVYLTTADVFGKKRGLITAAVIALSPWVIFVTGANIVENFLIIFLSLTLWSIIKSFKNSKYLVVAGVFAALTYLTKTNIGVSLVIIATIFFVIWQFHYRKKEMLKDPYLIFFVIIVLVVAFARNYMISQMSYHVSEASSASVLFTSKGLIQLLFELPFHLLLPATYFLFFLPETSKVISQWRSKNNSLLILVLLGGIGIILLHAAARQTWLQTLPGASERYFTTFIVPTIWLFLGYLKLNTKNPKIIENTKTGKTHKLIAFGQLIIKRKKICFLLTLLIGGFIFLLVDLWWGVTLSFGAFSFFLVDNVRRRVTLLILAFLIAGTGSALDYTFSQQFPYAMDDMRNFLEDGDIVAIDSDVDSFSVRSVSLYLSDINVEVVDYNSLGNDSQRSEPNYILTQIDQIYENYTLLKKYNDTSPLYLRARIYTQLKRTFLDKDFEWPRHPPIEVWVKN